PVTLAKLAAGDNEYLSPSLIPKFDLYLSFTGGPTLAKLERQYGAKRARVLYCSVDPQLYYPNRKARCWDLGYIGTHSADRQPTLERLMLAAARKWPEGRFVVAGPLYPESIAWPANLHRIEHLPPSEHRKVYNTSRFTLNVTRADMISAGYSPSVRLFEAAACGTPIITDSWRGLEQVFEPGREVLVAESTDDALRFIRNMP